MIQIPIYKTKSAINKQIGDLDQKRKEEKGERKDKKEKKR